MPKRFLPSLRSKEGATFNSMETLAYFLAGFWIPVWFVLLARDA